MAIRLRQWLSQFCAWHDQYREGELPADLLVPYTEARSDLCATLVVAQRLDLRAGGGRQALRVERALPVCFEVGAAKISAITQDISTSGLSALVGRAPPVGTSIAFQLKLGREVTPVVGRCRVVAAIPMEGSVRMAVTFEEMGNEDRAHVEDVVLDAICAEIRTMLLLRNGKAIDASPSEASTREEVG